MTPGLLRVYSPAPLINSFLAGNLFERRFHALFNPHVAPFGFPSRIRRDLFSVYMCVNRALRHGSYLICCHCVRWYIGESRLSTEIDRIIVWSDDRNNYSFVWSQRLIAFFVVVMSARVCMLWFLYGRKLNREPTNVFMQSCWSDVKNAKIISNDIDCVKLRWIVYLYCQTRQRMGWCFAKNNQIGFHGKRIILSCVYELEFYSFKQILW